MSHGSREARGSSRIVRARRQAGSGRGELQIDDGSIAGQQPDAEFGGGSVNGVGVRACFTLNPGVAPDTSRQNFCMSGYVSAKWPKTRNAIKPLFHAAFTQFLAVA